GDPNGVISRWDPDHDIALAASKVISAIYVGEPDPLNSQDLLFTDDFQEMEVSFIRRELELSINPATACICSSSILRQFYPTLRKFMNDWRRLRFRSAEIIRNDLADASRNGTRFPNILDHAGKEFDMKELLSTLHMYIGAGSDTVSGSMSNLLKYFCLHPEVQETARAEVLALERDPETSEDFRQLPYLRACILENQRLHLPGPILPFTALRDCELLGQPIKAGTRVVIMLKKILEESYERGTEFRPERWLSPGGATIDDEKCRQFVGFGDGPRKCPGRHLAMEEMIVYSSRLLRHFRNMRVAEGSNVETKFTSAIVMRPQGLLISMDSPRSSPL
ncbi:hypothetical protein FOZ62_029869, partial [Perkinsus olseni]